MERKRKDWRYEERNKGIKENKRRKKEEKRERNEEVKIRVGKKRWMDVEGKEGLKRKGRERENKRE